MSASNAILEIATAPTKRIRMSDIHPHPENPRLHSREQIEELKASIQDHDYSSVSITVSATTHNIVKGNGMYSALSELGCNEVDVVYKEMSPEEELLFLIRDNRLSELSSWDMPMLNADLAKLADMEIDLERTGFTLDALEEMGEADNRVVGEDDFNVNEALEEEPITQAGDLWLLGKHRVLCGDSTKKDDVDRVMAGEKVRLVVSSPPYFNQREYSVWEKYEDYLLFAKYIVDAIQFTVDNDAIVAWNIGSDEQAHRWMPSDWWVLFRDNGWIYQESIAWVKSAAVWSVPRSMHIENSRYFPALRWEICLVLKKGKHPVFDKSDRDRVREFQDNVWQIAVVPGQVQSKEGHPAMYPVELPGRFITAYTMAGQFLYDPFLGSGTTLIAADQLDRICYGLEMLPRYCDVIVKRYINHVAHSEDVYVERGGKQVPWDEVI